MLITTALSLVIASYLWGSVSPSYIVARWLKGIDLRHYGTGTLGGTNLGAQLGFRWKVAIAAVDFVKGLTPTALALALGLPSAPVVLVGLAAVCGHNWSLYLRFAGGRGLAAAVGVICVWDVRLAALVALALAVGTFTRYAGLMPVAAFAVLAPAAWFVGDGPEIIAGCFAFSLIIVLKRLEANRLPLPKEPRARMTALWRRLWLDRDVPLDQPWEERKRID